MKPTKRVNVKTSNGKIDGRSSFVKVITEPGYAGHGLPASIYLII